MSWIRALLVVGVAVLPVSVAASARADEVVSGTVYADLDGDGAFSQGDRPLAGVVVAFETDQFVTTDAEGGYQLFVGKDGIVWASAPEGYQPGPVWTHVTATTGSQPPADLGLRPIETSGPLRFVQGSDAHVGNVSSADVHSALQQATDLTPAPYFLVITGDFTSNTARAEMDAFEQAIADLTVPFVPVVGNHDWHDGGALYRKRFGPPMYSFTTGGVHFIVLNFNAPPPSLLEFVGNDLRVHPEVAGAPVVVLTHAPPEDEQVEKLGALGVDYLFTGHIHTNRVTRSGKVLEYNTEALAMGGFDYTPAGYRVVSMTDAGLVVEHHTVVDDPIAHMTWPRAGDCLPTGTTPILAAVELGATLATVEVVIDGGASLPLAPAGGWTWRRDVDLPAGTHSLELRARAGPAAVPQSETLSFCVQAPAAVSARVAEWPQLGGGPLHASSTSTAIEPPLRTLWARAIGGHALGGTPIVTGGRVIVPVVDYQAGVAGGLIAFDLSSGRELWSSRAGPSVHGTPVSDGTRVAALGSDGVLRAYDVVNGAPAWTYDLGAGLPDWKSLATSSPTLADGIVYAIEQQQLMAIDMASGKLRWQQKIGSDVISVTRTAPLVAGGLVVATTASGKDGLCAFDAHTGAPRWRLPATVSRQLQGAPVAAGGHAYVFNIQSQVTAVALASGKIEWQKRLYGKGDAVDWTTGPVATPALGDGRLFLPTPVKQLVTLDTDAGERKWTRDAAASPLRLLPLTARTLGFFASPLVAGDTLWLPGADGTLAALAADTGKRLWQAQLGAPLVSGLAAAGDLLVVTSYDGTVRVMAGTPPRLKLGRIVLLAALILVAFLAALVVVKRRRRA